jgi:hypothetical protein
VKTIDGIFEIDRMEKSNGTATFNKVNGLVWLTAGQENEKHGHDTCRPLHTGMTMDKDLCSTIIFGGDTVDCLKGP